jgi:hypothetical protein
MGNELTRVEGQHQIETKADGTLLVELIRRTTTQPWPRANLDFAVQSGLIADQTRRAEIQKFLEGTKQLPTLPTLPPAPPPCAMSNVLAAPSFCRARPTFSGSRMGSKR